MILCRRYDVIMTSLSASSSLCRSHCKAVRLNKFCLSLQRTFRLISWNKTGLKMAGPQTAGRSRSSGWFSNKIWNFDFWLFMQFYVVMFRRLMVTWIHLPLIRPNLLRGSLGNIWNSMFQSFVCSLLMSLIASNIRNIKQSCNPFGPFDRIRSIKTGFLKSESFVKLLCFDLSKTCFWIIKIS